MATNMTPYFMPRTVDDANQNANNSDLQLSYNYLLQTINMMQDTINSLQDQINKSTNTSNT